MKKVIVTEKGAALKCNSWKAGQIIEAHENIANDFLKRGIALEIGSEGIKVETKKAKK